MDQLGCAVAAAELVAGGAGSGFEALVAGADGGHGHGGRAHRLRRRLHAVVEQAHRHAWRQRRARQRPRVRQKVVLQVQRLQRRLLHLAREVLHACTRNSSQIITKIHILPTHQLFSCIPTTIAAEFTPHSRTIFTCT